MFVLINPNSDKVY